ncbi:MAG: hypothetical protein ABSG86_06720 [Thermoguttaceae bacterium]|jgi:uncharacterized DUF497 family protein
MQAERLTTFVRIVWDEEDEPDGNVRHLAEHGLTVEEVEHVLENPMSEAVSGSTGRKCCFGYTPSGEFVIVVYEEIDAETLYPITAYEVPKPQ